MTIKKVGSKFQLISATGKNLGTFPTKAAAEKREKQVKFFKNTKKADSPVRLREFKKYLSESVGNDYDLNDDEQREAASCLYIAVEELEREDKLRRIANDNDQTLEELMVAAKPQLEDGTPVDLASGAAQAGMFIVQRKRDGNLETGNLMGMSPTGYTNEHDHMYDSRVAGFTTPDPDDGHSHWVDVRDSSTRAAGTGFHIHTTQPHEVQRDDLIVFEDEEMARRSDFGGITLGEHDMGESTTEFTGLFTGVSRAVHPVDGQTMKKKKKVPSQEQQATDARRGLPITTRQRERGNLLDNLASRESRARERQDTEKKRNENAG